MDEQWYFDTMLMCAYRTVPPLFALLFVAVLPILVGQNTPALRVKTVKVPQVTKDIKKLLKDMMDTLKKADGAGLAAPQVNRTERICLALIHGKIVPLINPEIAWHNEEKDTAEEGCLSLPGLWLQVTRPTQILLKYTDENGAAQERKLEGWDARVVQHEVDHLEGILIVDYK